MTGSSLLVLESTTETTRRLSYYNLEVRDAYFTRLKNKIEIYKKTNGQKVVLCSHSCVFLAFR